MTPSKEGKNDAWMPLWIGAYLADTMRLTTIQHGAYLLLLIAYWRERTALLDDDEELRSITKLEKAEWKRMRPVLAKFFKIEDGVWWHKRVEHEIAESNTRSKHAKAKAKAAAQARWGSRLDDAPSNAPSTAPGNGQGMHEDCPTQTQYSDAGASGGNPPIGPPVDQPIDPPNPPPVKSAGDMTKAELWSAGRSILMQANMPEAQCRSFIGKLAKDYGNDVAVEAVRSAVVEQPVDPVSYLKACCQRASGQRKTPMAERTENFFNDDAAQPERTHQGSHHVTARTLPTDVIDIESRRVG